MVEISEKQIIEHWLQYFPEFSTHEELSELIADDIDFIHESYNKYNLASENLVNDYLKFSNSDKLSKYESCFSNDVLFISYIHPVVNKYFDEFYTKMKGNSLIYDFDILVSNILENIYLRIDQIIKKSVIYFIGTLKDSGQLLGDSSKERFNYFKSIFSKKDENIVRFYREFFELLRISSKTASDSLLYVLQIFEHISLCKNDIEKNFFLNLSNNITKLELGIGDTHQNGKSVVIIFLNDGNKFLYKPHSLEVDYNVNKLVDWITEKSNTVLDHKFAKVVLGDTFGFTEFVEFKECYDKHEVSKFYERIGELLCILYSLNSVDFHYENLIAHGEYPVLIDLETIIHPNITSKNFNFENDAFFKAGKEFDDSVLTTGLLPISLKGTEVGGVSVSKEQISTFKTDFIKDSDNDNIHIDRELFAIFPERNNPILNGSMIESSRYISEIKTGFTRLYDWIIDNKQEYINKVIKLLVGCQGRVILNPTLRYAQLLNISYNPEFTKTMFERKLILKRIFIENNRNSNEIIDSEFQDLLSGDIPYFKFNIGEQSIQNSLGKEIFDFKMTSFETDLNKKISCFTKKDLIRQLSYIDASFTSRYDQSDQTNLSFYTYQNKLDTNKWLKTAESIGELIIDKSFEGTNSFGKKDLAWVCVTMQGFEEDNWIPSILGHDFYSGNSGIAFFLAQLYRITGKQHFIEYAKKAVEFPYQLLRDIDSGKQVELGAFTGVGGTLYSLNEIATLTNDFKLVSDLELEIANLKPLIKKDPYKDLISGTAGLLAVLLKLSKNQSICLNKVYTPIIQECVEFLVNNKIEGQDYIYWNSVSDKHYSGFAHGSAGIRTFLYQGMDYIGDIQTNLLEKAYAYEGSCFNKEFGDWERSEIEKEISYAWCHGSPGILLSQLILKDKYNICDDVALNRALRNTLNKGFGNNPTYCHGDLGNLAIINYYSKIFKDIDTENKSFHMYQNLFEEVLVKEWDKQNLKSTNTYGLMVGLAGWGYSMLSNYSKYEIPNFLWLE